MWDIPWLKQSTFQSGYLNYAGQVELENLKIQRITPKS